jgi:lysophospholipase L1-like esterase
MADYPSTLSDVAFWVRGDSATAAAGRITQATDKSGSGNHLLPDATGGGTGPVALTDPYPCWYFDAAGTDNLKLPDALGTNRRAFSFFAVIDLRGIDQYKHYSVLRIGSSMLYVKAPDCKLVMYDENAGEIAPATPIYVPQSRCVVGIVAGAGGATLYVNGQTRAITALSVGTATGGNLGRYTTPPDYNHDGCFYEAVMVSRAISGVETTDLLGYFEDVYPEAMSPVANVLFFGDSRVYGTGATSGINGPKQLRLPRPVRFWNLGVPGERLLDIAARAEAQIARYADPTLPNLCVVAAGSNALVQGSRTWQQEATSEQAIFAAALAAGCKTLTATIETRTDADANALSFIADYNAWRKANWATYCDGISLIGDDPLIGMPGVAGNTTYYADGVHPTTAGYAVWARIMARSLHGLMLPLQSEVRSGTDRGDGTLGTLDIQADNPVRAGGFGVQLR